MKKLRFEVFKRDGFTCGYCGNKPPAVVLEVDHINPKSNDGNDDINNLITACFDCNRGKGADTLDKIPNSLIENLEIIKEKESQLLEYNRYLQKIRKRQDKEIREIETTFQDYFPKWTLSENFKNSSLRSFLKQLPFQEVKEAMQMACGRIKNQSDAIKYFCGICWRRIKNG